MSLSKFIHDYLDGELNDTQKETLFAELAESPDLRHEFDQQVRLHTVAKNDMSAITPPVESTSAIFSALGFSLPSDDYLNRVSGGGLQANKGWSSGFWRRNWKKGTAFFLVAFLASIITTGVYFMMDSPDGSMMSSNNTANTDGSSIPVVSSFAAIEGDNSFKNGHYLFGDNEESSKHEVRNEVPASVDLTANRNSMSGTMASNNNIRTISEEEINNLIERGEISEIVTFFDPETASEVNSALYTALYNNEGANLPDNFANTNTGAIGFEPLINDPQVLNIWQGFENRKMGIEVRQISSLLSGVDSKVETSSGGLKDLAIAFVYNFDKNHSLGLELGNEQFPQVFDYDNGTYNQAPERMWVGAFYKFSKPEWGLFNGIIYPYTKVLVGGTSIGPIGRAQLGLVLRPANSLSFTIGGEAALLMYNVSGRLYGTDKYGLTLGMNYHF